VITDSRRLLGILVAFMALGSLAACADAQQGGELTRSAAATQPTAVAPEPAGEQSPAPPWDLVSTPLPRVTPSAQATQAARVPAAIATPPESSGPGSPQPTVTYVVQAGDTLSGVAEQFDVGLEALAAANGITNTELVYAGQVLNIPGNGPVQTAAQAPGPAVADHTAVPVPPSATSAPSAPASPAATQVPPAGSAPPAPAPTADGAQQAGASPGQSAPGPGAQDRPAEREPVMVNGRTYDAYVPAAVKEGQFNQYTCEFDAAWIVLKTYGFDVGLDRQVEIVGLDKSIEPYYEETTNGVVIYGGDVTNYYSGDYKKNFLARSSGAAMRKVFDYFGLNVTPVRDRPSLEEALLWGELVWIKTTVDIKPWREATWVMPDGRSYKTVLGNDHALVVMGFNSEGVVIRDPLGPTSTNWQRQYEYEVPWDRFMASWGAQEFDGLAVARP
jgi:LysM repeat protein